MSTLIRTECCNCKESFEKTLSSIKQNKKRGLKNNFCSRSCSASFNNRIPKRIKRARVCPTCLNDFYAPRKYCGDDCIPRQTSGEKRVIHKHRMSEVRKSIKKKGVEFKGGSCELCGYNKSLQALHFHHKEPGEKDFAISSATSWKKAKIEIEKCLLVCANCHAELHDKECGRETEA